jgi:DNA-binding CsgD family transcriptional regulator
MDEWDEDDAENVIHAFHRAAARPELWPAALQKLADTFEADGCALIGGPSSSIEPICSSSLQKMQDNATRSEWVEDYLCVERILLAFELGHDVVVETTIVSSSELDRRQRNSKFTDQLKPRWIAATVLAGTGPSSIILTLVRGIKAKPFSQWEIEALRRIGPGLREVGNLALRLAAVHHEGILRAFVTIDCGALLLDRKGRVLRTNTKAEALMREVLTVRDGFLKVDAGETDAALQELIRSGLARPAGLSAEPKDMFAIIRPTGAPLLIQLAPLPISTGDQFRRARYVLTIVDPDACLPPVASDLRKIFGLTSSEAAIATELCLGRDLDEIAAMRQVTTGTLRGQLKTILFKTGTRRQSELVALLLRYSRLPVQGRA